MSAYTTIATGNWSNAAIWTGGGGGSVPGSGDTATLNHAVTMDTDVTVNGISINAAFTLAASKALTLQGNVTQLSSTVTLNAGTTILFNTTGGDRTWTFDHTAPFVVNGTNGSFCTITKSGTNKAWFPSAGGIFDRNNYDVNYCNVVGITNSAGTLSFSGHGGGQDSYKFLNCNFNGCGTLFGDHQQFDVSGGKDYRIEDCIWFNSPTGATCIYVDAHASGVAGAGTKTIQGCGFDKNPTLNAHHFLTDFNYFDIGGPGGLFELDSTEGNVIVENSNGETFVPNCQSVKNNLILADHVDPADRINGLTGVGNPHVCSYTGSLAVTYDGNILYYPHVANIDAGDGFFSGDDGSGDNATLIRNLVLPSAKDGKPSCSLHSLTRNTTGIKIHHNTVVGGNYSVQLAFNERTTPTGQVSEMKSNLVACTTSANGYAIDDTLVGTDTDMVTPAAVKNNYIWNPAAYTDPGNGHSHPGYGCRLSSDPDGTNLTASGGSGPNFVDSTRNPENWGVTKGLYSAADWTVNANRRAALDAVRAYLLAHPRLGNSDMIPWIKAGFAPQNAALNNAGHDGVTIGAVAFSGVSTTIAPRRLRRMGGQPNRIETLPNYGPTPANTTIAPRRRRRMGDNRINDLPGFGGSQAPRRVGARILRRSSTAPIIFGGK